MKRNHTQQPAGTKAKGLEKTILQRGAAPKDDNAPDALAETTDAAAEAIAIDETFPQGPEIDLDNLANDEL